MKPTFLKQVPRNTCFMSYSMKRKINEVRYSEISYTKNIADIVEYNGSKSYLTMMPFC